MTTTLEFLNALYPDPVAPGKLVVWTAAKRRGTRRSRWASTLDEAAEHAHRVRTTRDVYFGVALHDPIIARTIVRARFPKVQLPSVRGCHDSALALPAIWADLVVAGRGRAANDPPPDPAAVFERLEAVARRPSVIVSTGGGYQVYWLLRELWTLEGEAERERALDLLRRLQAALRAAARLAGGSVRDTADLARMPRLPGTLNLKAAEPTPVSVLRFPRDPNRDRRFDPGDFDHLPPVPEAAGRRPGGEGEGLPPARFEPMFEGCAFLRHCLRRQDRVDPARWIAALGLVGRSRAVDRDRVALAHAYSRRHPGYDPLKTEETLEHAVHDLEPRACVEIEAAFDADGRLCGRCPHRGKIENPIVLGRPRPSPAEPAPVPEPDGDDGEPPGEPAEIVVSPREHEVNDRALAALAAREPNLFERAGVLVQVVRPRTGAGRAGGRPARDAGPAVARPIQEARLGELLARHCVFVKPKKTESGHAHRPVHPPRWCARALLARGSWPRLPHLAGIVECPVLRADGSVLQTPGHDPESGLVYLPSDEFAPVIEHPTRAQAGAALDRLREVVADFPFRSDSHFAAWLSSLLTPLARDAFDGPAPLALIDANVRGAGKSLLADVASTLLTGRPAARMSYTGDEDELRKSITGIALEGTRLVLIDNVAGGFGSPTLDRALTADTWRDRRLGGNGQVALPLKVTWLATGNNVSLRGDTPRRCLHVRLESDLERPELRTGFRRPRLLRWVRRERPRLLPAALTLLRAWVAAPRDLALPGWGSFEGWSDLVRSAVVGLGLADPAATREDLEAGAGAERGTVHDLVHGLAELLRSFGGSATAKEILETLAHSGDQFPTLRSALADLFPRLAAGDLPRSTQLAGRLRSYRGRIVRGACIDQASKSYRGVIWTVRQVA